MAINTTLLNKINALAYSLEKRGYAAPMPMPPEAASGMVAMPPPAPMDPAMMQQGAPMPVDPATGMPMDPAMMQQGAPMPPPAPMDPAMMQQGAPMPPPAPMDPAMMQQGAPMPVDPATGMPVDPAMMQQGAPVSTPAPQQGGMVGPNGEPVIMMSSADLMQAIQQIAEMTKADQTNDKKDNVDARLKNLESIVSGLTGSNTGAQNAVVRPAAPSPVEEKSASANPILSNMRQIIRGW